VRSLVLDVDALVHARRPGLIPEIEELIATLPGGAYIERSVYRREAARSGLIPLLGEWQGRGLLREPVDYRDIPDGDERFRRLSAQRRWRSLSAQDRATLVLALAAGDCGVLTCERQLAEAAREHRVHAIDLFDVVRVALRAGRVTVQQARGICAEWDRNRFSAGRPIQYCGDFDRERSIRDGRDPLPF
jgi:hypothetical protein